MKFNFKIRKNSEGNLEIMPIYIKAALKLADLLRSQLSLIMEAKSQKKGAIYESFLNMAMRFAINAAIAPAATPPSILTTAKPSEHDWSIAISALRPFSPKP